jgi:hypothetical protein
VRLVATAGTDVPLRCECGKIRGVAKGLTQSTGTRCVCYCRDCQAFARFLGRDGIMDAWGGTDIYQTSPGRVQLEIEGEALACVRLSAEGMHRWYCASCKTPIGNTMNAVIPFVGLIHSFMDHASSGVGRDELLGIAHPIQTDSAYGEGAPKQKSSAIFAVLLRTMGKVIGWKITGAGKPSPFFDAKTNAPAATPKVLTPQERGALEVRSS